MLTSSGGYSAHVELYLVVEGKQFPLGQVGPAHCILRDAVQFEPTTGEIVILVDGAETRVPAFFPDGASTTDCRVAYIEQTPIAAARLFRLNPEP